MKKTIIFTSIIITIISTINIILWTYDNNKIEEEISNIYEVINEELENEDNEYIKGTDMFDELKKTNNNIIGWIVINDTNINYPFVQYKNNSYYLNHSFYHEQNEAGWIFLDYRNNINFNDKNTIIYGHNRFDGSMFGTLKKLLTKKWLNNKENHIISIDTKQYTIFYKIFSVYKIKTTNDYLMINFKDDDEYKIFLGLLLNRSIYNFKTNITTNDKILTLSTCSGSNNKLVVHAKQIRLQYK